MSDEAQEFVGVEDMLDPYEDEAIMPIASLRIVKAIDSDGDEQIRFKFSGRDSPANLLGMLEFVKQLVFLNVSQGAHFDGED